jgi:hypothetical protein
VNSFKKISALQLHSINLLPESLSLAKSARCNERSGLQFFHRIVFRRCHAHIAGQCLTSLGVTCRIGNRAVIWKGHSPTEATILGEHVAAELGDQTRAASYKDTVLQGIDCIDRLQVSHEQRILFADPELPIGGMRRDLASFDMRCDHSAHALTCLTTALEMKRQG